MNEPLENQIRIAVDQKAILWVNEDDELTYTDGGTSALPSDVFRGQILFGELVGCIVRVYRIEANGKVAFNADFTRLPATRPASMQLDQAVGQLLWNYANQKVGEKHF